jgi:hypothetical protein
MSVIPAIPGTETGGSQFKANLGKISTRLLLNNKLKEKGLGIWLKW